VGDAPDDRARPGLYWGTSEWSADEIRAAWLIAERHGLASRRWSSRSTTCCTASGSSRSTRACTRTSAGLTTWSPLASGLLTGKYRGGIPAGSRGAVESCAFLRPRLTDEKGNQIVGRLEPVAAELG